MSDNNRISDALARFDAALQRVELAVERVGASLSAERGTQEAELRELRNQAADLSHNNREAGRRIEMAIAKIRAALGG